MVPFTFSSDDGTRNPVGKHEVSEEDKCARRPGRGATHAGGQRMTTAEREGTMSGNEKGARRLVFKVLAVTVSDF